MRVAAVFLISILVPSTGLKYFYCSGGPQDGFSCLNTADKVTCGSGGTCVQDVYVDACGSAYRVGDEQCDDGNLADGDGCSSTCTIEPGWTCSGGSATSPDTCTVICGDGIRLRSGCCTADTCSRECDTVYGCDDGNTINGDGCSELCAKESGYECWSSDSDTRDICLCTRSRVSAGYTHTCGIDSLGKLACWGDSSHGKTATDLSSPTVTVWPRGSWAAGDVWVSVAAGGQHTCALHYGGAMTCWGWVGPSLLGDGRLLMPTAPDWQRISQGGFQWESVSAGYGFSCGVLNEARFRYLPACGPSESPGPTCRSRDLCTGCRPADDWSLSYLQTHPCALSFVPRGTCLEPANRSLLCWGDKTYGQNVPPHSEHWLQGDAGQYHACGVMLDGTGRCWGEDYQNQSETPDIGGRPWVMISAGGAHSCGIDGSWYMHCWGRNVEGQASPPCEAAGSTMGTQGSWLRVSAGGLHTCGIRADQSMDCWGANEVGQCNVPFVEGTCTNGPSSGRPCTTQADCGWGTCEGSRKRDWQEVSAGDVHTCAVDSSNQVFCWGGNMFGSVQLPGRPVVLTGYGPSGRAQYDSRGYYTSPCL